jgi:hypothetical protein
MWHIPSSQRLSRIPRLYETEGVDLPQKVVHLHFFLAGSDWYAVEFDGTDLFWGFVILHGHLDNAEWGYFSLKELQAIRVARYLRVDCELEEHWTVRPAYEIDKIRKAQGWAISIPA